MENQNIIPFEGKEIRKIWHNETWYFSVVDVIEALTGSIVPRQYWNTLKKRETQLSTVCLQLKLKSSDGKNYKTDCANTEGVFRILMSVPSPKAEPLKLWLAQVGKERLEEINDPELGLERLKENYKLQGYSDEWIERRLKSISIRKELTDEWKNRGVKEGQEYAVLTVEIAKGTFGLSPSEHARLKGLKKENLRDHMSNLELIFTMLGEDATRSYAVEDDAQGFNENYEAAQKGGKAAGGARLSFEQLRNQQVVSPENYLHLTEKTPQNAIEKPDNE
ncbi:MAG: Bro-N domain-containing protein [Saprospiraceae bacterium]|nr:Bro-N domain-containing protein [Saprospiraceae bacterium]